MEQGSDSVTRVIRPTFNPTDEQLALIDEAKQAWKAADEAEAAAWQKTQKLRDADVPDLFICERIEQVSKSTLNRKLGPRRGKDT